MVILAVSVAFVIKDEILSFLRQNGIPDGGIIYYRYYILQLIYTTMSFNP